MNTGSNEEKCKCSSTSCGQGWKIEEHLEPKFEVPRLFHKYVGRLMTEKTDSYEFFTVIKYGGYGAETEPVWNVSSPEVFIEQILRGPDKKGTERYDGEMMIKVRYDDGKEDWHFYQYDNQWGEYKEVIDLGFDRIAGNTFTIDETL